MTEAISVRDAYLLYGWEVGFSGYSWFKKGNDGNTYQAFWLDEDKLIFFVDINKHQSFNMDRKTFDELFS